jgi:hypothetical protein
MALMTSLSLIAMSPFAEEPPPITLSDGQTPSSIVIIGPSNWLLTLTICRARPMGRAKPPAYEVFAHCYHITCNDESISLASSLSA